MEEIGLKAVLDDKDFQKGIKNYQDSLDDAVGTTEDLSDSMSDASDGGVSDLDNGLSDVSETSQDTTLSLTDMWSALQMGMKIAEVAVDVVSELVQGTIDYAMEVKDTSALLGVNATEASTLIQVLDDLRVSSSTLTMAAKKMKDEGMVPNIETLIKLSQEYQNLETPVERNTFLFENFGRAGIELQRVMEAGPETLREYAAAAQQSGLVVDETFVQEMEDARSY